jgi:hypothetical protein
VNGPIFVNPRMLAKPLEIAGMMVGEERPMRGLDFLDDLSLRQSSLVLDEFQVDRRCDGGDSVLFHVQVHFLVLFPRRHGRRSWTAVCYGAQRSF